MFYATEHSADKVTDHLANDNRHHLVNIGNNSTRKITEGLPLSFWPKAFSVKLDKNKMLCSSLFFFFATPRHQISMQLDMMGSLSSSKNARNSTRPVVERDWRALTKHKQGSLQTYPITHFVFYQCFGPVFQKHLIRPGRSKLVPWACKRTLIF